MPLLTQRHGAHASGELTRNLLSTGTLPQTDHGVVPWKWATTQRKFIQSSALRYFTAFRPYRKMKDKPSADRERNGNFALILASCRAPLAHRQSS